jgi:hypothetical protein
MSNDYYYSHGVEDMKINSKILSIPPYISTSWKNIASLHVENQQAMLILVVTLLSGVRIEIPHLEQSIVDAIFTAHARYIEQDEKHPPQNAKTAPRLPFNLSMLSNQDQILSLGLPAKNGGGMEAFGSLLQHNPDQADSPDLPADILEKIAHLSKTLGIEDPNTAPKPEPHCNCMHCQIARALQKGLNGETSGQKEEEIVKEEEEIVTDEDLKFKNWDVKQTDDKLYIVTNPLDIKEQYSVYLGDPVGCNCGESHCEHIRAVLNT